MMFIKKLGAVLTLIGVVIIRIPLDLIATVLNWVDFYLIKTITKLSKVIAWEWLIDSVDEALYTNYIGMKRVAKYFKNLAYELHN